MRRGRLREAPVRLHLHRVDQVGKLDGVLDEEHRHVVAHQIPIALRGIELHGKAPHIARRIDRTRATGNGGEACEYRRLHADLREHLRRGEFGE